MSWAGGEGWGVAGSAQEESTGAGTGIRGLRNRGRNELASWGLEHWSWQGSGNVPGGDHGGRARERKTKIISDSLNERISIGQNVPVQNTAGITTQMATDVSARIAGSGGLL